jgi:hypothetical protein
LNGNRFVNILQILFLNSALQMVHHGFLVFYMVGSTTRPETPEEFHHVLRMGPIRKVVMRIKRRTMWPLGPAGVHRPFLVRFLMWKVKIPLMRERRPSAVREMRTFPEMVGELPVEMGWHKADLAQKSADFKPNQVKLGNHVRSWES